MLSLCLFYISAGVGAFVIGLSQSSSFILSCNLRRVSGSTNFIASGTKTVKRLQRRQYDPGSIQKTIGLALGRSVAIYRLVITHCTLTYKAVGTTRQALNKHPQKRRPKPVLVETTTALDLSSRIDCMKHSSCGCHLIFWYNNHYHQHMYKLLWTLQLRWLIVLILGHYMVVYS